MSFARAVAQSRAHFREAVQGFGELQYTEYLHVPAAWGVLVFP